MATILRCTRCGQKMAAPTDREEHWVECSNCGQKVYAGPPEDEIPEIDLAPVDEDEEERARRRHAQDRAIERRILDGTVDISDTGLGSPPTAPEPTGKTEGVTAMLVRYVRGMSDGQIADCESIAASLVGRQDEVASKAKRLLSQSPPPEALTSIPPAVIKGYLRQLLAKL
ncbi:MAG: hypothetical protein JXQ73_30490 [Phycisphaerae bacterium]|nr:hypothetical protein [Phycisphaerae bacterium]